MNTGRRKPSRVQGGWAHTNSDSVPKQTSNKGNSATSWQQSSLTADMGSLQFQPNQQCDMASPETRVIREAGAFEISTSPSGISRLRLIPGFYEPTECDLLLDALLHELPWQQEIVARDDETYVQPRMTAWFGDVPYSYSGITHSTNCQWLPVLKEIKERIETNTELTFNSLLANLYRDGHDHVTWHSDDESSLGPEPIIASLSFGDTRTFELRKKLPQDDTTKKYLEFCKIPLESGTLLIMDGAIQKDWEHRVPREYHDRSPRVNLTFRSIFPE